jgi:hypothetical protein
MSQEDEENEAPVVPQQTLRYEYEMQPLQAVDPFEPVADDRDNHVRQHVDNDVFPLPEGPPEPEGDPNAERQPHLDERQPAEFEDFNLHERQGPGADQVAPPAARLPNDFARPSVRTRSGRTVQRTQRLMESEEFPTLTSLLVNWLAIPASIADPDTMYLREALRQPDREEFLKAMVKEIEDHTKKGHWRVTNRSEMRQRDYTHKPIMAVWSFKRKRDPDGNIVKYKARLCCHGGQTVQGVHYEETYSPVVAWSTMRLMLILAFVNGWYARQIDFVLAFPQAKVRADIYMHVPEKFVVRNKELVLNEDAPHPSQQFDVVKLIKNVYGLADASLTWHEHLKVGLKAAGFQQSKVDPCLFYKGTTLLVVYVDDAICFSKTKEASDELISTLRDKGYVLTDEGDVSAYLGLKIDYEGQHRITMRQPAFIERLIEQASLKDQRMHDTPADGVLMRDENGPERKNEFHYRSIIGQLNYLAATTRPDILCAVHNCARFCEDPRLSHEKAVKRIIRYLKRTKDKGLSMEVDKDKGFECYVDANFAGDYVKHSTNPRDCLSRTGFVVKYAGCPVTWASKLQSTIALSTTEAEYIALSTSLREVIYLMNLSDELRKHEVPICEKQPVVKCKVYEDNVGAIELAKMPKLRPRTKHIGIQYHHFRTWTAKGLNGESPRIQVEYITTEYQQADILTKALQKGAFERIRKLLCGW